LVQRIISEHQLEAADFPHSLSEENVRPVKKQLLSIFKLVYHKARLEQRLLEHQQIQHHIKLRYTNYEEDLTKMIDSILNRAKRCIVLDRIVYTDPVHSKMLIMDTQTIKKHAVMHF